MTTEPTAIDVSDEEAALFALMNEGEEEALRIIGEMSSAQRGDLARFAERLSALAYHYEPGDESR